MDICVRRIGLNSQIEFFPGETSLDFHPDFLKWAHSLDAEPQLVTSNRLILSEIAFKKCLPSLKAARNKSGKFTVNPLGDIPDVIARFADEQQRLTQSLSGSLSPPMQVDEIRRVLIKSGFKRANKLRTFQLRDIQKLLRLDHGANFSVPGAGKTASLLAVHAVMKTKKPNLRLLVVAPRNAMVAWDKELGECFTDHSGIIRLTGGRVEIKKTLRTAPPAAIITYQQLYRVTDLVQKFLEEFPTHFVLDESHRAKGGYQSLQGAAALDIAPLALRRDILSGTPMPQGFGDLESQFEFLWPGHDVTSRVRKQANGEVDLRSANLELERLFTRTTKLELGLTPPIRRIIPVNLPRIQRDIYQLLRSAAAREIRDLDIDSQSDLRKLGHQVMALTQAASNPELLLESLNRTTDIFRLLDFKELLRQCISVEEPGKLAAAKTVVEKILDVKGEKIVVWSSFVGTIKQLTDDFSHFGAVAIYGDVKTGNDDDAESREGRIKLFEEDKDCRVMVANPAACGEGISLHRAAHNALYVDRSFNAAHYLQSVDRIHRLGLADDIDTNVYIIEARDTVDQVIASRISQKVANMEQVLNDPGLAALAYDPFDLPDSEIWGGFDVESSPALLKHLVGGENR